MIEIQDTEICTFFAYNTAGFVVCDQETNYHSVSREACANHYLKMHENASGRCVGERNILSHAFVFYSEEKAIKLIEKRLGVDAVNEIMKFGNYILENAERVI